MEYLQIFDELHLLAEESGFELKTKRKILAYLTKLNNIQIIEFENSNSILCVFDTKRKGKTLLFRADIDAVRINGQIQHLCGHDGHTTVLICLADLINKNFSSLNGKILLLFQEAEEIGRGAKLFTNSEYIKKFVIEYTYAFHNLPKYKSGVIVYKSSVFSLTSTGIEIKLFGVAKHAADESNQKTIDWLLCDINLKLKSISEKIRKQSNKFQITTTYIAYGEPNFGSISENAQLNLVIRDDNYENINIFKEELKSLSDLYDKNCDIQLSIRFDEEFPLTINSEEAVNILVKTSQKLNFELERITEPFKWSEDFGYFSRLSKSCLFGIGIGENANGLHTKEYQFNTDIIPIATSLMYNIINDLNIVN